MCKALFTTARPASLLVDLNLRSQPCGQLTSDNTGEAKVLEGEDGPVLRDLREGLIFGRLIFIKIVGCDSIDNLQTTMEFARVSASLILDRPSKVLIILIKQ